MISKNIVLNFFIVSFLFGLFSNNLLQDFYSSFFILVFIVLLFLNFYIYKKKFFIYFLFIVLGFISGFFLSVYNLWEINKNSDVLNEYYNVKQEVSWEIDEIYKMKEDAIEYKMKVFSLAGNDLRENDMYAIVSVPLNFKLELGDVVNFESKPYKIENFDSFKYKQYLLTKKIYFKVYAFTLSVTEHKDLNALVAWLYKFRKETLSVIKRIYPKEEAIFLGWILLGAREELSEELKKDFNNSGLTHLIAVSGFNITILIIFFSYTLKFVPVFFRTILIIAWIVIFTILVWDTAPVVRASIMWVIWYIVLISGRKNNPLSIILLTAVIMVIFSPLSLNYDVSFHLSFLAVLGIIYTQDFFNKIFFFLPKAFSIKEALVLTMASLSFTLPVMIFNFWQISFLAPISNVLVTWTIPIAMFLWFLSILIYWFSAFLWGIIWYITWILLKYDITIVHIFWNMDFAILKFDFWIYSSYLEIFYFVVLIFAVMYFKKVEEENVPKIWEVV